jgi:hypothetical protein
MMRRGAATVLAALALAGCSGGSGDKPGTLPPLGTPTATAVPTAAPVYGAAAFVRFFFTELDKAYQSGGPMSLDGLAEARCGSCRGYVSVAERLATSGHRFAESTYVDLTTEVPPLSMGIANVDVTFRKFVRHEVDRTGRVIETSPAQSKRLYLIVQLQQQPDGWRIRGTEFRAVKGG